MKEKYDIVVAGWTGLKASLETINDDSNAKKFATRYPRHFIEKIKNSHNRIVSISEVKKELDIFSPMYMGENSGIDLETLEDTNTIVYEISKGGLYRALWDMTVALKNGFEIERYSIPVLQETIEVCDFFNLNPYEVNGEGSFLIYTDDATNLIKVLVEAGISAKLIGFATKELAKQIIRDDDIQYLDKPRKSLNGQI